MADTNKKPVKKASTKTASKPAKKAPAKTTPTKVSPDFYALREQWMKSKEQVAYWRRRLSQANASQSSIADRQEKMDAANKELLKANRAEKVAAKAFTDAQRKARAR